MITSYSGLIVWQRAMELAESVYTLSAQFSSDERFGLTAQVRRAAVSIPSNIAEGYERRSRKEYRRFVTIACGSLAELETQLLLSVRVGMVDEASITHCLDLGDQVGRMLRAIERSLRSPQSVGEVENAYGDGVAIEPPDDALLSPQPSALSPTGLESSGVRQC